MKFNTHTLEKLSNHEWPGNVRELQHAVEKAVILSDTQVLKPSDFIFNSSEDRLVHNEMTLECMERKMIADSMRKHSNNISVIADKLGITRQTLYNKMKKYGL